MTPLNSQNFLSSCIDFVFQIPIIKELSAAQKKVACIALTILSLAAGLYTVYRCCSREHTFSHDQSIESPIIESPTLFTPLSRKNKSTETLEVIPAPVWKATVPSFPSIEEAKILLARNSSEDPLLDVFSSYDRQIRMKRRTPVSSDDFLKFYLHQVKGIGDSQQATIKQYLDAINVELKKLGIQLPEKIHFIRTTGQEEIVGTAAYCRYQTIVFNHLHKKLLAHELFHIYSRCNPEMRKKLYALVGYHIIPPLTLPEALEQKRVVNPDLPFLDAYINVKYKGEVVPAMPIDFFDLNHEVYENKGYFIGMYHKFAMLEKLEDGEFQFKLDDLGSPILFDFDEAEDLYDQIGENTTYIDSAEEILADNFAMMILGIEGKTPELIEKMKQCFLDEAKLNTSEGL